jgi:hypothetical protein
MPGEAVFFLSAITLVGGFVLLLPVVRALAERIRARPDAAPAQLQAWREDIARELHQVRQEVGELAERVDFAERLLAKRPEAGRLAPPGAV